MKTSPNGRCTAIRRSLIASVGRDKILAYNLDMAFILVPPDQKRVPVKLTEYSGGIRPGPVSDSR